MPRIVQVGLAVIAIHSIFVKPATCQNSRESVPQNTCAYLEIQIESHSCHKNTANDYAQLSQFRAEDSHLQSPSRGEQRVVYIGDSITASWPLVISKRFLGKPAINRGIAGQVSGQMLLRFRQDVVSLKPRVVVILAGTNDVSRISDPSDLALVENNLASMVDLAHANGIEVIVASLPPVSDYEYYDNGQSIIQTVARSPILIRQLNKWIEEYARRSGCAFVDYFALLVDDKGFLKHGLSSDGLHPNAKAYSLLEPSLEEALRKLLDQQQ